MERLTAYYGDCEEAYLSCERCGKTGIHECWTQEDCTKTAVDRLAAIEDILGDEYDLDRLCELAQADREGRCVALPCKVGDTVYQVDTERVYEFGIKKIIYDCGHIAFEEYAVGKTVFLTREDAEDVLKGEQDG